ncbi:MAG: phage tail tube protein [bacterium]|nr:phage tail tube protein [bacterium]
MARLKGKSTELMMSLYTKELTYDAGVTMNDTNACSMKGYTVEEDWPDEVQSDREEITGSEFATVQEIITKGFSTPVGIPKARPNDIIGLMALAMGGGVTSTQDGVTGAYTHKVALAGIEAAMPSIQSEIKKGGIQYGYKGVMCNSIKLACDAGQPVSVEVELIGSGTRATSATAFASKITESWVKASQALAWLESGTDISISASLVQGAEDISSATPADLKARIKRFEFSLNNNMEGDFGYGSEVFQVLDKGIRELGLMVDLTFADATEMNHFLNQDNLALELDFKGAQVPTASTLYYGFQLVVPRCRLQKVPLPKGGPMDALTQSLEVEFLDDGTNQVFLFEGYNAKSQYLA